MVAHLTTMFRYDDWANRLTARSLEQSPPPPERAVACMDHIIGASWLWLDRIAGRPGRLEVWPSLDRDERWRQLDLLATAWSACLNTLGDAELRRVIHYLNSKGERWSNRVEDALWHLTLHSAYHRGQIALLVRGAGGGPAYTDFIQAVRTGEVSLP